MEIVIFSQELIWWAIGTAIALGLLIGLVIVFLIYLRRRKTAINSLLSLEDLIGQSGVVEIPFDHTTAGKVRIQLENHILDCVAYSHDPHTFIRGDHVIIVGRKDEKVWVIPVQEFQS